MSLLKRLRVPGETKAWDRFVELYSPVLFSWARRVQMQEADAADLVQEVFALLVRKLPAFEYDPGKGFRNWLRTVTLNKWRELLRKRSGAPPLDNQTLLDQIPAPAEEGPFWETEYRAMLMRRLLDGLRADFQPATWQACWACAVDGRSATEVGQQLKMSAGAVRAAKFRVLARLRDELEGLLD